jgi:hypothetical protein
MYVHHNEPDKLQGITPCVNKRRDPAQMMTMVAKTAGRAVPQCFFLEATDCNLIKSIIIVKILPVWIEKEACSFQEMQSPS